MSKFLFAVTCFFIFIGAQSLYALDAHGDDAVAMSQDIDEQDAHEDVGIAITFGGSAQTYKSASFDSRDNVDIAPPTRVTPESPSSVRSTTEGGDSANGCDAGFALGVLLSLGVIFKMRNEP